jgi:DNA-binding MarR family transcriptional regulator
MTNNDLQKQMMAMVRAFGLHKPNETPCGQPVAVAEAYTLTALTENKTLTQRELVAYLNLAKSTVSRLVKNLVKRGWVAQVQSEQDGRVMVLQLTANGEKIAGQIATARQTKFQQVLIHIPPDQQVGVVEALAILVEAMRHDS